MAEKPKPPKQLTLDLEGTEEKQKTKKSTSSYKVVLSDTPASSQTIHKTRKKPTVTTRSMTVKIPKEKQPADNAAAHKGSIPKKRSTPRTADQPNPHVVQTHSKKNRPQTTQTSRTRKQQVVPPKIGKRKAYRPPLSRRLLLPLVIAMLLATISLLVYVFLEKPTFLAAPDTEIEQRDVVVLTIERGMTARAVSRLLEQLGVVEDAQALLTYFVDEELATIIQTGTYVMKRNLGFSEIASMITKTEKGSELTIPPGFTLADIDEYLKNRFETEDGAFFDAAGDLIAAYQLSFAEGWLLGGVYTIHSSRAAEELVLAMYQGMLEALHDLLDSPLLERYSVEELLIVASMIQAETQDPSQMGGISSVIHNRLAKGEPLGIDATTRYELHDWVNPIPTEALETMSPYNTRRKEGLPPTGICCPGIDALHAAFFPEETPY
ncbi:MAG: endolytic transglycosylase MltG, partial [Sphaerochaetaceae bacterium]